MAHGCIETLGCVTGNRPVGGETVRYANRREAKLKIEWGGTVKGSIEFDGAGEAYFSFVAIVPGEYAFSVGDVAGTFIVR